MLGVVWGVTAACGSPGTVPPDEWAGSVCRAVRPWSAEIQRLQGAARRQIDGRSDARGTKTELITLFSGMAEATDVALGRIRGAGVPDVDDGDRIAGRFAAALGAARDSFTRGKEEVATLPTDDQARFYDGVSAAGKTMSRENGRAGRAFEDVSSPELDSAFEGVDACR